MHMFKAGEVSGKKILLVDKNIKKDNDRTWCFWETGDGLFESIVYKQWNELWFHSNIFSKKLHISPYKYKLIKGIDFYNYCFNEISKHRNITFRQSAVERIFSNEEKTGIVAGGETFYSRYIFNSILFEKPVLKPHEYLLLQHFKGWFIKTAKPRFDAEVATLMDFRTDQLNGSTFFYVLPFSSTRALVEYTLFSPTLLNESAYEAALKNYIENELGVKDYSIEEKEFGIIPMSNLNFPSAQHKIINIGTAGGQTKASSGYTFKFIQKQSANIVSSLKKTGMPFQVKRTATRFKFYDSVLLNILNYNKLSGDKIFTDLFQKNNPQKIFRFLDNETSLIEELKIISSLPAGRFSRAAAHHLKLRMFS